TAAYPELRLVAVMQGDVLRYAETLEEALQRLFASSGAAPAEAQQDTLEELVAAAQEAFDAYLASLGEQRFEDAAAALSRLSHLLAEMNALVR
ncbi:MAG: hypothetical protein P8Y69_12020, partial [Gammaproteobacteria bacterium]